MLKISINIVSEFGDTLNVQWCIQDSVLVGVEPILGCDI